MCVCFCLAIPMTAAIYLFCFSVPACLFFASTHAPQNKFPCALITFAYRDLVEKLEKDSVSGVSSKERSKHERFNSHKLNQDDQCNGSIS